MIKLSKKLAARKSNKLQGTEERYEFKKSMRMPIQFNERSSKVQWDPTYRFFSYNEGGASMFSKAGNKACVKIHNIFGELI